MTPRRSARPAVACRTLCLMLGVTVTAGTRLGGAETAAPLGRSDLAPYRVMVRVTFAADPSVTPGFRRTVVASLGARIEQTFGAAWSLLPAGRPAVTEDDDIAPANEAGLARLTSSAVLEKVGALGCDKAYLLVVHAVGPKWFVAGREWDGTCQSLGPVLTATTCDRRAIAEAAMELLLRLYSPLLIVNDADRATGTVTLTVRAGSIPLGDPRAASLSKGAIFAPIFRFLDAKGNIRKIQPVPWTYLVLEEAKDGHARCTLASSYRAPLAANMRRRVEAVALLLRPALPETRLKLVAGKTAPRPLAGMFVDVQSASPAQPEKEATSADRQELLSDRRGAVTIAADPRRPLRLLEVRSGSVLLSRRPFVPGVEPEVTLDLADDEIRLNTERDVDLLRVQLVETVARRAALVARTRASLKTSDGAAAEQFLADLERVPAAEFYLEKLNEIRVLSLEEAARRKDRVAERRIEDLCQKTRGLIEQYLPGDRLQTLREEVAASLAEAKAIAAAKAAPPPRRRAVVKPLAKTPTKPVEKKQSSGI